MKNGNQQNPAFRQYEENIKATEKKLQNGGYMKSSKVSRDMGESRRMVEELIEAKELREELELL